MDGGAWWAVVHGVAKSWTWLSDFTTTTSLVLHWGKAMAPHSSTLAWKILWAEEPGRLQSMGSQSWTRLSDFTFTFHFHALEKEIATHSSVLAWRIPGTGELGGLPSMRSRRVGDDWSDLAAAAASIEVFRIPRSYFSFVTLFLSRNLSKLSNLLA